MSSVFKILLLNDICTISVFSLLPDDCNNCNTKKRTRKENTQYKFFLGCPVSFSFFIVDSPDSCGVYIYTPYIYGRIYVKIILD